jgi:hypothetical protein
MTAKSIERALQDALIGNGPMKRELYEADLEESLDFLKASMAEDGDDYIFAITENKGDVAMVLVESSGEVHINEGARERLQAFWPRSYQSNIEMFIPSFADQLEEGEIPINGVKVARDEE